VRDEINPPDDYGLLIWTIIIGFFILVTVCGMVGVFRQEPSESHHNDPKFSRPIKMPISRPFHE
jgi:hypothetical protein